MVRHDDQPSMIYLTVIHIWDKQFGHPFIIVKDALPTNCMVEDGNSSEAGFSTPTTKDRDDDRLYMALGNLGKMSSERAESTRLIASAIKGNDSVAAEDNAVKLVKCIGETTNQISIHELEVAKLGGKKRSIKDGPGSKEQKTKKLKPVTEDIKQRKKLFTTLKKTLDL